MAIRFIFSTIFLVKADDGSPAYKNEKQKTRIKKKLFLMKFPNSMNLFHTKINIYYYLTCCAFSTN